jgi:hypothetical protein
VTKIPKLLAVLALCAFASSAAAQGIVGPITTGRISRSTAARYVFWVPPWFTVANGSTPARFVYPYAAGARLVDVLVYQVAAGTVGTSWTLNVRNAAGTSLLTTTATLTLASGANQTTDAKGAVALPSGWTRPVLKTDATVDIAKGGFLDIYTTETGAYTVHPTGVVVLVFEPKQ